MSQTKTPEQWALRLTQLLNHVQASHGLPRFPIDIAGLAMELSRQLFPESPITVVEGMELSAGVEGMLLSHPNGSGEWGILYNSSIRSTGLRNFTLAHELGHYLLHRQTHPHGL